MRRLALAAGFLLAGVAGTALASNHDVPGDNGTTLPEPEEATERGPRDDPAISWFPAVLALGFLGLVGGGVLLYLRRSRRDDLRRRP